jgi:hypothetical protein
MAQGVITTLAGSPYSSGYSGDGGPASAATFSGIQTPVVDSVGNIYFADANRIRRIGTDGNVTTIAGSSSAGVTGDGGPAVNASIGGVAQLAIYGTRLCFGDNLALKIRCIDLSSGYIYGYGTGTSGTGGDGGSIANASFMAPISAAFDDVGNFYIADNLANSVRRVDPSGTITMFVGPGPGYSGAPLGDGGPALGANILTPRGIYYRNGGLYIADLGNDRIRRVDLATGIISTVAGNGTTTPGTDGGSALMAGIVPFWIAVDPSGNLFLTSQGSICRVDPTGVFTTIANPSGNSGIGNDYIPATQTVFSGVFGLGWDPVAQRLLISDGGNRLRQIFYTSPTTTTLIPSANPVHWNQNVTLTASVSPVDATGSVRFYYNYPYPASQGSWTYLGSAPLVNGTATFTWTAPIGDSTWSLSAVYAGDPTHNLSQSAIVSEVVQSGSSSVVLTSSANPATPGQSVTFTATVTPSDATGSVTFLNNGTSIGSSLVSGGVATFTTSTLPTGTNSVSASYGGDSRYAASTSPVLSEVVKTPSTTTTLTINPNPSVYSAAVTLTATVTPSTATGSVQFLNGATTLGSATLSGGQAQFSVTSLPVGANSLTAVYSGDANNAGSTSAAVTQTVNKQPSTVTLTSSANPVPFGQSVTFTATVSPSQATGTVQFQSDSTVLGTVVITNGTASFSTTTLPIGDHSIYANYSGDSNYAAGPATPLIQTISKAVTSVALTGLPNPSTTGQTVTLTATVTPSTATGLVQFFEVPNYGLLGTLSVSGGSASLVLSPDVYTFPVGTHTIIVNYNGDANNALSTSPTLTLTVVKVSTTTTVTAAPNPSAYGDSVTLTAAVSPASAAGVVQFFNGGTLLGSAVVNSGQAQFSLTGLPVGSNSLTAVYSGDASYVGSTSTAVTQTVNKQASTTTLYSLTNPSSFGQAVVFRAIVSPSQATGTVQFLDGSTVLGSAAVSNGAASLTASSLAVGVHSIVASYSGDSADTASTSAALTMTVNKAASNVTVTSSMNPAVAGQSVTFTATVTPASATGTVQFLDGATVLGSATLNNGAAVFATSSLAVGSHSVTANYLGDGSFSSSQSSAVPQQVVKRATTTTLASAPNPSTVGMTVTLTATVSPSSATGTVQFLNGSTVLASAALVNGSAQVTVANLPAGSNSLTAVYGGDDTNAGSTSAAVVQTVAKANSATTLAGPASPLNVGQVATFTATVAPSTATGTVQFLDGGLAIGTVAVNGGTAVFSTTALSAGGHSITAAYSGDGSLNPSTSAPVVAQVVKYATTTTLTNIPNLQVFTGQVSLTASVTPPEASGSVQYFDGTVLLGSATIVNGQAFLGVTNLTVGPHTLTAVYGGDATFAGSTSPAVREMIAPAASTTTISATPADQASAGQAVTFTAMVAPAAATGSVQFNDGNTPIGTAALVNGVATFSTSALKIGNHSITAAYLGDSNVAASASAKLVYKIKQ